MWAPFWHQYKIPALPWASDFEIQFSVCKMGVIKTQKSWKDNSINIYDVLRCSSARNL